MEDGESENAEDKNLQFESNDAADNRSDNDYGSAKRPDSEIAYGSQNTFPWIAGDSHEKPFVNTSQHSPIFQPSKFNSNRALTQAWQPPTRPQVQVTEVDEYYPTSFEQPLSSNYFDPFDINPPTKTALERADVKDSSGFASFPEKKKEAKKVCRQISRLLRDKSSRSRGSRMFQKRRKRADKFAIVGYGTQPAEEEDRDFSGSEDSGSLASSKFDCDSGTPAFSTDDEIPAYDSFGGVHNVITVYDNLSPSEQIVHNQLKNLAMDVGTMRGKGAKIFAKRQQRMEKYVITDENRRQNNGFPIGNQQSGAFQDVATSQRPSYVRPGSSIGIGTKKAPPAEKYNRNISGYCTDFEDDSTSSRYQKPQVNYFSDCEVSVVTDKPRRTRPSNRRAWGPQEETDGNNNYVAAAPASKEFAASCSSYATGVAQSPSDPAYGGHSDSKPLPSPATEPTKLFRSVKPPSLAAPSKSFVKPYVPESVAKDPVFISTLAANTSNNGSDGSGTRKTWSRVTFCPRKSATGQQSSPQVVQYPGNRQSIKVPDRPTWNLPPSPAKQKTQQAYRLQSAPQGTSAEVQKSLQRPNEIKALPTVSQNQGQTQAHYKTPVNCNLSPKKFVPGVPNGNISYKPKPAMILLEKPMENISKPWQSSVGNFVADNNKPEQVSSSEFIQNVSQKQHEEPSNADSNQQNVNRVLDFVQSESVFEDNGSLNGDTFSTESSENLSDNRLNNCSEEEEGKAKMTNGSQQTFTSTLPSRCFSPPVRPNTPTQNTRQQFSPKLIKIATTNNITKQYSPSKSTTVQNGSVPTNVFSSTEVDSAKVEEPVTQTSKVSACLKVLDPTKALFQPKPAPAPIQPSPTLCAVMQSESDESYGSFKTPPISYQPPVEMPSKPPPLPPIARPAYDQRPVRYQPPPSPSTPKSNGSIAKASPRPLGIIADSMKGKGARMFAKQQQRMQRYTKETSVEDFPELQKARTNDHDDCAQTVKINNEPRHLPGFAKDGKKIEPGEDTKQGMMKVLGEFQKGKVKRPSDARKKGRDPLYYQQYLSYRPPSAADFVEPPADSIESYSDSSSVASSMTNTSSLSSSLNQDSRRTFCPENSAAGVNEFPWPMNHNDSVVSTQNSQATLCAPPKVAPKPSKAVITRQLSKPSSPPPPPIVAISPSPEIHAFQPALSPATPSPKGENSFVYPSMNGGTTTGQEPNEHRGAASYAESEDPSYHQYPFGGIAPPSYQEVADDNSKYRPILRNGQRIDETATPMDELIDMNHNMKGSISKPYYNSEGNGVSVKVFIPQ